MTEHICTQCKKTFIPTRRNWTEWQCEDDLPVCNACLDKSSFHILESNRKYHQTTCPPRRISKKAPHCSRPWNNLGHVAGEIADAMIKEDEEASK